MRNLRFGIAISAVLVFFASPAVAQNRPDCLEDPQGACFEAIGTQEKFVACGLEEAGIVVWVNIGDGDNDFFRTGPHGSTFAHTFDKDVVTVFCPWETVFLGFCAPMSPAPEQLYYGTTKVQANGTLEDGVETCPFLVKSQGEVTRPDDGRTLHIKATFHTVRDRKDPSGCRIQTCRVIANEISEDF